MVGDLDGPDEPGYTPLSRRHTHADDVEDWPVDDEDTECHFCGAAPAVWVNQVDRRELHVGDYWFDLGPLVTCERCRALVVAGDVKALLEVELAHQSADGWEPPDPDAITGQEQTIAAIVRASAAQPGRRLALHVAPPAIAQLLAAGYEPLDHHTGVTRQLGAAWPAAHAQSFPETRGWAAADEVRWYVRSPWPSVRLDKVVSLLWSYVHQDVRAAMAADPCRLHRVDEDRQKQRMREVFGWSEARARAAADAAAKPQP